MKLKLPILKKLAAKLRGAPPRQRTYRASSRRAQPAIDDYDDEERPTTRLSSAFIVVLLLHLVAVGGIYAFNSIKAHRRAQEIAAGPMAAPAPAVQRPVVKPAVTNSDAAYVTSATPAPQIRPQVSTTATTSHSGSTAKTTPKQTASSSPANADQAKKNAFLESTRPKTYTVHTGDNPTSIAHKLGVSQSELLKLNNIDDPKKLQIGQTLKVPPPKSTAKTDSSG